MAEALILEVITPERWVIEVTTPWVTLPGMEGELGILPQHVPLVTAIQSGVLRWSDKGREQRAAVHHGYAQVSNDRVTVLVDMAERREDIERERAVEAGNRARQMLRELIDDAEDAEPRARQYGAELQRAITRQAAGV